MTQIHLKTFGHCVHLRLSIRNLCHKRKRLIFDFKIMKVQVFKNYEIRNND